MTKRTYGQYCGLANALDLIGERWTLLIVRDLAIAPKRFSDLLEGLPGIGTSLLSERLHHLEDQGLARRAVADRPTGGVVYELTEEGQALAVAMSGLATWGAARLEAQEGAEFRPDWAMFALQCAFNPERAAGVHDCYEFRLEGTPFWVLIDDGDLEVSYEKPRKPDFILTTDVPTLARLGTGVISPEEAMASGRATFQGDPEAGMRSLRLLGSADAVPLPIRRGRRATR